MVESFQDPFTDGYAQWRRNAYSDVKLTKRLIKEVCQFFDREARQGRYTEKWDGRDDKNPDRNPARLWPGARHAATAAAAVRGCPRAGARVPGGQPYGIPGVRRRTRGPKPLVNAR